jgi:hypothetical protein
MLHTHNISIKGKHATKKRLSHTRVNGSTYLSNKGRVLRLGYRINWLDGNGLITGITLLLVIVDINLDVWCKIGDRGIWRVCDRRKGVGNAIDAIDFIESIVRTVVTVDGVEDVIVAGLEDAARKGQTSLDML